MIDLGSELTERAREIVAGCLAATVQEEFFPEWEFQTLFGVDRSVVEWPSVDTEDWTVRGCGGSFEPPARVSAWARRGAVKVHL